MLQKKSWWWIAPCLLLIFIFSSCKKFVVIETPPTVLTDDKIFANDKSATSAMVSIYINMMNDQYGSNGSFVCFSMSSLAGMSANELTWTQNNTSAPDYQQFNDHGLTPPNRYVGSFWSDGYKYIYRANAIIQGLSTATALSDSVKTQLAGEARFMRAFCYFYLVNLFGDVPLVMGTAYQENMLLPRTPAAAVWEQIITDLKDAKALLTDKYFTAERLRPNRYAASALLARAYLYNRRWLEAENEATSIINSGVYGTTLPPLDQVFKKGSPEAIWQLQPVIANANTPEGGQFVVTGTTRPNYELTPQLLNAFEAGDNRKAAWIGFSDITNNPSWAYPAKYKAGTGPLTEYYIVFRLTEQYLIRAEARAQQAGKIPQAQADLNMVRSRAGLNVTTANDQPSMLQAIEKERQTEFFAEWGHRWLDLKRTNRAEAVLKPLSPPNTWKPGSVLYPIPDVEIRANPKLTQNDAYLY
ncbi:RagB/SusD family nutrient uptake outer membrane protein [Chitinophaga qingshengii]|uniref:RagB/SusD family nutrient uptake outer membrane protein n=1 Tax=Chitinophaga qingshengii TaxID=1569794 RepID=A0ABR7TM44_9BACT|nr:RagB/SusD family nutrient uptake outer membrane protein [Chitinophaga qingshengii]MBC9930598.1 RagB/SusD family nutrient uptake outer membrane protein [Chitinophaga qingshengii]